MNPEPTANEKKVDTLVQQRETLVACIEAAINHASKSFDEAPRLEARVSALTHCLGVTMADIPAKARKDVRKHIDLAISIAQAQTLSQRGEH